jgi:hypothetical protein
MATIDLQKIIQGLVGAAATAAGAGPILKLIIDQGIFPLLINDWLFPSSKVDLFATFEKRIDLLVDRKLEAAIGEATFKRVASELKGLADAFTDYVNVVDLEERKMRLAGLITQADILVAGLQSVPSRFLPMLTDVLLAIAVAHMAALLDEVQRHPERYENQIALNETAIRYSDLAGAIRDRFLWYRMSMIAEGKGVVEQTEIGHRSTVNGDQKKISFSAFDDLAMWWTGCWNFRIDFLFGVETDWISAIGVDQAYYDKQQEAQGKVATYADTEKQKVYDWWNEHLCNGTAAFMQLVDWDGRNSHRQPRDRLLVRAYPRVPSASASATLLQRVDLFLGQQMDQYVVSGPRYVQTYRLPGEQRLGGPGNMLLRADTSDTAGAAIYLTARGDLRRAADLVDGLCTAIEHDAIGGGRVVAASDARALLDPFECYTTSVFAPDGATRDVGNACWAGLALTRLHARTGNYRYLHNAMVIGRWIVSQCAVDDAWQGFSGGEDAWANKRLWRSVEHNVDAFALFNNLFALTGDAAWQAAAQRARTLVQACRTQAGYYVTGTGETQVLNDGVIPTDVQTWTALAGLDPDAAATSLQYILDHLVTSSAGFTGFKFALAGSGVQNEVTAGAAMALQLQGGALRDAAAAFYASLEQQQQGAPGGDGLGLVATPDAEADTGPGLGWKYFNWPHAASSAWTGLAFLAREDASANPYAPIKMNPAS